MNNIKIVFNYKPEQNKHDPQEHTGPFHLHNSWRKVNESLHCLILFGSVFHNDVLLKLNEFRAYLLVLHIGLIDMFCEQKSQEDAIYWK